MMDDLATWLLEQIAEDERMAAALQTAPASVPEWEYRPYGRPHPGVYEQGRIYNILNDEHSDEMLAYVANWDPARVLAECDAKRRIIELHPCAGDDIREPFCVTCTPDEALYGDLAGAWPCLTLRLLALPYADRPGYREAWKPCLA